MKWFGFLIYIACTCIIFTACENTRITGGDSQYKEDSSLQNFNRNERKLPDPASEGKAETSRGLNKAAGTGEGMKKPDIVLATSNLKVGDVISGMKIVGLESGSKDGRVIIRFSGSTTISGEYINNDKENTGSGEVAFKPDEDSVKKLPSLRGTTSEASIVFSNTETAKNEFGKAGSRGTATVMIEEYLLDYQEKEQYASAKLTKVIRKDAAAQDGKGQQSTTDINVFLQGVIDTINKKDDEAMMKYVDTDIYASEAAAAIDWALNYYSIYFNGKKVVRFQDRGVLQEVKYINSEPVKVFRLYNEDGVYKDIRVVFLKGQKYIMDDDFLRYSKKAKDVAEAYVNALKKENLSQLSSILYLDETGKTYSEALTRDVMVKCKEAFDINTMECWFTGRMERDNGDGGFVFVITGKKKGLPMEHEFVVVHGDGQVGLKDQWAPLEQ